MHPRYSFFAWPAVALLAVTSIVVSSALSAASLVVSSALSAASLVVGWIFGAAAPPRHSRRSMLDSFARTIADRNRRMAHFAI